MKDLRDPRLLGEALLDDRISFPGMPLRERYDCWPAFWLDMPDYPGDESPLDRYGDPRRVAVTVETIVRRVPVIVATRDGSEPARVIGHRSLPIELLGEKP